MADAAHIVAGVVSCLVTVKYPVIGVVSTILFLIYQLDEEWHLKDEAWRDILEYAVGYYLTGIMVLALNI